MLSQLSATEIICKMGSKKIYTKKMIESSLQITNENNNDIDFCFTEHNQF